MEICVWLAMACFFVSLGVKAAYRNGVTDGYGYSREPRNSGYKKAGRYLREHMSHRWPELRGKQD